MKVPSAYSLEELFEIIIESLLANTDSSNNKAFRSQWKEQYAIWYGDEVCTMTDFIQDLEMNSHSENPYLQVMIKPKPKAIQFAISYGSGEYRGSFTEDQMIKEVLIEFCNVRS